MPELFVPGNILVIRNYDFEDGSPVKDKIIIILGSNDSSLTLIQSLTTSRDRTGEPTLNHGCHNKVTERFHYYFYDKNISVGKTENNNDFNFKLDTFIYFIQNVNKVQTINLLKYRGDITYMASLYDYELMSLIDCICNSKFVPKEIKNELCK